MASTQRVDVTQLDGSRATLSGDLLLTPSAATYIEFGPPLNARFVCGLPGYGKVVAADFGIEHFSEEYAVQGGTLRIGSALQAPPRGPTLLYRMGVWEGSHHSLWSLQYGGQPIGLLSRFTQVSIRDSAEGVILSPISGASIRRSGWRAPRMVKRVPGLGVLQAFALTPDLQREVPRWRGEPVKGGELYRTGEGETLLLHLVGGSAYTRIYLRSDPEAEVLRNAAELAVDWGTPT